MPLCDKNAPRIWKRLVRGFAEKWNEVNPTGMALFTGVCGCDEYQTYLVFPTIDLRPNLNCPFCRKPIPMHPLHAYIGGGRWRLLERNSEGGFTAHIVSVQDLVSSLNVHGAKSL